MAPQSKTPDELSGYCNSAPETVRIPIIPAVSTAHVTTGRPNTVNRFCSSHASSSTRIGQPTSARPNHAMLRHSSSRTIRGISLFINPYFTGKRLKTSSPLPNQQPYTSFIGYTSPFNYRLRRWLSVRYARTLSSRSTFDSPETNHLANRPATPRFPTATTVECLLPASIRAPRARGSSRAPEASSRGWFERRPWRLSSSRKAPPFGRLRPLERSAELRSALLALFCQVFAQGGRPRRPTDGKSGD
ncbi:hypothetical protein SAMN05216218_104135 [Halorientalis regularis]|uniref:Uncharacterized protein n=1 Tax=Halorientalis regularis TaxID=660518 RepID=A0A1G7IYT3_9EURY|nr:hypothetical protein SAMN05216218_104135 [Halorientalis regularis]